MIGYNFEERILGECLLVASLPGKALRTLVDIARLAYQFSHCFTFQTSDNDVIFDSCIDSASLAMSFKKCNVIMT